MFGAIFHTVQDFFSGDIANMLYWCAAAGGTLFFLAVLGFSSFEISGVDGADSAPDGTFDPGAHIDTGFLDFQFISLRTILAFVTMFGWTGVVWGKYGLLGFGAAVLVGGAAMFLTALVVWGMLKLQHSGNVEAGDFIGKNGTVYLEIPEGRKNCGKITVSVGGSTHELSAVSDRCIPTGSPAKIREKIGDSLFLVEKI